MANGPDDLTARKAPPEPTFLQLNCGRKNCKILNPVRPDLWCRDCLLDEVERYRARDRERSRSEYLGFDY